MSTIPASVGILTFNSASTLRRTLESVRDFADIIICDGGSTDKTLELAQEFGARVIVQDALYKNPNGTLKDYSGVRNQTLVAAQYDWFLYIDSDETISDGLREEVRTVVAAPGNALVYDVPIGILMDGRYIRYSTNYPGYQNRFFNKRSGARFVRAVHERITYDHHIKVGTLLSPWYIHTTRSYWHHYIRETEGYRPIEVRRACEATLPAFLYSGVLWHTRAAAATLVKALYNYAVHGFKETLPVRGELGRVASPLILIWRATLCRIKKSTS
jgi:glycosyltransferase involved in cell wall biosynthesis